MASPHVSGVAALLYARFATQSPTNSKVRSQILCTGTLITIDDGSIQRRVDAFDAVSQTKQTCRNDCWAEWEVCDTICLRRYRRDPTRYLQCINECDSELSACIQGCNQAPCPAF